MPRWVLPTTIVIAVILVAGIVAVLSMAFQSRVTVPEVVGQSEGIATTTLSQAGLSPLVAERRFDAAEEGTVLEQSPEAGEVVGQGDEIELVVSAGSEELEMPDVVGVSLRVARAQLEQAGLVVRVDPMESEQPPDTVLATNPSPGATVRTSDIVRLIVAAESDASSILLPYQMDGLTVALDPSPVEGDVVDAPMEVARRLQSLLEASGVQVVITRSSISTDTTPAGRAALVAANTPDVIVGLDAPEAGERGFRLDLLSQEVNADTFQSSRALADEMVRQMQLLSDSIGRADIQQDPVLESSPSAGVRVQLGVFEDAEDAAAFRDPAWSDDVARALYRGLGERFGSQ